MLSLGCAVLILELKKLTHNPGWEIRIMPTWPISQSQYKTLWVNSKWIRNIGKWQIHLRVLWVEWIKPLPSDGLHVTLIILGIGTRPYFPDILRNCTVPDKRADQKLLAKRMELITLSIAWIHFVAGFLSVPSPIWFTLTLETKLTGNTFSRITHDSSSEIHFAF